jgi:hypothetical protein
VIIQEGQFKSFFIKNHLLNVGLIGLIEFETKHGVCLNQNIINIQLVIKKTLLNSKIDFVSQVPN